MDKFKLSSTHPEICARCKQLLSGYDPLEMGRSSQATTTFYVWVGSVRCEWF